MQFPGQALNQKIIANVLAGLTVSFVALSLGAAFGLLSGRGAFAGMISAAIIATITALLGGTRVQCSGPTGPMTTVTAVLVAAAYGRLSEQHPEINPDHVVNITIILMAAILVLAAVFRFGRFVTLVPNVVVSGFMNGIAIIIWLDQFKKLFGFGGQTALEGPVFQNVSLFVLSATLMFTLPLFTRRYLAKYETLLSATILTLVISTGSSHALGLNVEHVQLSTTLKSVADVQTLVVNQWPTAWSPDVLLFALPFAFQLAFLAYLDTLLTSLVVDKMTGETTRRDKELFAQGVAGGAVALVGGVPGAQATIRSVLIIKEKGSLRLAGILVGVFALIEIVLFQDAINLIPQAVFAGILLKVGYDVFDWPPPRLYLKGIIANPNMLTRKFSSRHDHKAVFVTNREMLVIIGTTLMTVLWNLNAAVAIFTAVFYLNNLVFSRHNPMRDLISPEETERFGTEL